MLVLMSLVACEPAQGGDPVSFVRSDIELAGEPSAVLAVDVTEDGIVDLVVTTDRVLVLIGAGDGKFVEGASSDAGDHPVDLAAADLNEDGHLDLAVANHDTDYVSILLGDGTGAFAHAPSSPMTVDVEPHPHAVAATDIDGDGHVDLLVDHRRAEGFLLLTGKGDGSFEPAHRVGVGGDPYRGLALADLNRDRHMDLLAPIERGVGVALGDGRGAFRLLPEVRTGVRSPFAVAAGDFNGDGLIDVGVGSGENSDAVALLLGDGTGAFEPLSGAPFAAGSGATKASAADLDGDGFDDLLVTSWHSPYLTILYGGQAAIRAQQVEVGDNPWALTAADLDRDGDRDVVVGNSGSRTLTILLSQAG